MYKVACSRKEASCIIGSLLVELAPVCEKCGGLPDGVLNIVTCSRNEAEIFLRHPNVRGITFVGSTSVGLHIYGTAAAHGKRVQALCEAKNHGLVLEDAALERSARGIINSAFGQALCRSQALATGQTTS